MLHLKCFVINGKPIPSEYSEGSDCNPSVRVSICLFVCLSVCLFVCFCLSACLSVCLSVCPSVHSSVCPSVYSSACLSVRFSFFPSVHSSVHLSVSRSIRSVNKSGIKIYLHRFKEDVKCNIFEGEKISTQIFNKFKFTDKSVYFID